VLQLKKFTASGRWRWLLLLPIPLVWCVAAQFGWFAFLENKVVDWRFRFRGERAAPVKVVYVDIDSRSIADIGGMPWSRLYFARACAALLDRGGVRAIGIDVVFSEGGIAESADWRKLVIGNRELVKFLTRQPPAPVVVAASYAAKEDRDINGELVRRELPLIRRTGPTPGEPPELPWLRLSEKNAKLKTLPLHVGLIDTMDSDTRVVPAFALTTIQPYWHLSIELARLLYGVGPDGIKRYSDRIELVRDDGTVAARIPLQDQQLLEVNWFSRWNSTLNPRISFSIVYSYAEMLASEKPEEKKAAEEFFAQPDLKDSVVLIGPVDPLLQDLSATSFDEVPVPKVGVHGNLVKTIVSGEYLHRLHRLHGIAWADFMLVFALTTGVSALATAGGRRSTLMKALGIALLAAYVAGAFAAFKLFHFVLPVAIPVAAAFTTSFAGVIWQLVDEEKQKGRIKGMFGTYLAPAVVNAMVESGKDPELGGHDAEITPYFSDIQSFSSFSEVLSSARLTELLNEYLTACTDIVQAEGGSLDKYIGDAVVAMYGAPIEVPDHAHRACVASLRVQRRIAELRDKWRSEGDKWPALVHRLRTRIGLNTGICMIGNMGSRTRFNYTMMGDNVNLAARMESGAKSWGVYTMCTEATKVACQSHGDDIVFRSLGRIVVKGRTQAVPIYEIVGLKGEVPDPTLECIALSEQALQRYYARDWAGARALFERCRPLEPNQPAPDNGISLNPSLVYLQILEHFEHVPPPADWDGTYVMKEK
jgi:adenylate cyclase